MEYRHLSIEEREILLRMQAQQTSIRQSHRRRKRHGSEDRRGQIPDRRMIDERPKGVNERRRIGDWEGDTVEGSKSSGFFATYVDRKARYRVAVKTSDKSAETVTRATLDVMGQLPAEKVKTVTFDNGVINAVAVHCMVGVAIDAALPLLRNTTPTSPTWLTTNRNWLIRSSCTE